MSDASDRHDRNFAAGEPVPAELQMAASRPPRLRLWVVVLSVLVVLIVGGMILTNTDEVPPSSQRDITQATPNGGTAPSAPHTEPQTKQ